MAFVAPSGSTITIDSGVQALQAGNLRIQIYTKVISGFDASYSCQVFDVQGFEVDFDLANVGNVTEFPINVPEFTFTISDIIVGSTGNDRVMALIDNLNLNEIIVCKITLGSSADYYYTTKDQAQFNYKERKITFKAQHPLKYGQVPVGKTWDGTYLAGVTEPFAIVSEVDSVQVNNFIERYLNILSDSPTININTNLYPLASSPSNGDPTILMESSAFDSSFSNATGIMRTIAASEGAILGNILGYGFYSNRAKVGSGATINAGDLESLEVKINHRNVKNFDVTITYDNAAYSITDSTVFNADGKNDIDVSFAFNQFEYAEWDAGDSRWEQPTNKTNEWLNGTTGVGTNPARSASVISAYQKALRASDEVFISGTIFGINTLRPDQHLAFGSGIYGLVDGNNYRPSYLKYNILENKIEFEAYQI